ncbi:hypothetical protein ABIC83_002872 [Roseateles asaccharophilus]|uniref:hypothetical protein n=1 Tax=Roseateles asaccharophilus TaxID=582607 RepID=UPI003835B3DB
MIVQLDEADLAAIAAGPVEASLHRALRAKHECSMSEIKAAIGKQVLLNRAHSATTLDELRDLVITLIHKAY